MKKILLFLSTVAFIISGPKSSNAQGHGHQHHPHQQISEVCELRTDMRKLWEDHITWTRNVILNLIDNLPGASTAVPRLLQNQVDIGDAFKPYFGNAAGDNLTYLLTTHITTAADLLTGLANGDTAAMNAANAAWYANADSIAHFLHQINPDQWSYQDVFDMMDEHLDLTAGEAIARKNADYAADVAYYDSVHFEILEMADFLTEGIVRQFPHQFNHRMAQLDVTLDDGTVVLDQNSPNPFADQTVIHYFIPDNVNEAEIVFTNSMGQTVKKIALSEKGEGELTVNTANLNNGIYSYSIVIDGKVADTKRMLHQN